MRRVSKHRIARAEDCMRLKSGIWVAAYLRRCQIEGGAAVLRRRGAEEAGGVFIKINRPDGAAGLYRPAPPTAVRETRPNERAVRPAPEGPPPPGAGGGGQLARPNPPD